MNADRIVNIDVIEPDGTRTPTALHIRDNLRRGGDDIRLKLVVGDRTYTGADYSSFHALIALRQEKGEIPA